jgi:hypothetical protein
MVEYLNKHEIDEWSLQYIRHTIATLEERNETNKRFVSNLSDGLFNQIAKQEEEYIQKRKELISEWLILSKHVREGTLPSWRHYENTHFFDFIIARYDMQITHNVDWYSNYWTEYIPNYTDLERALDVAAGWASHLNSKFSFYPDQFLTGTWWAKFHYDHHDKKRNTSFALRVDSMDDDTIALNGISIIKAGLWFFERMQALNRVYWMDKSHVH